MGFIMFIIKVSDKSRVYEYMILIIQQEVSVRGLITLILKNMRHFVI